jgi:hypothetical protein
LLRTNRDRRVARVRAKVVEVAKVVKVKVMITEHAHT